MKKTFFGGIFSFAIESYMVMTVSVIINWTNMTWDSKYTATAFGVNFNTIITGLVSPIIVGTPFAIAYFNYKYFEQITSD